MAFKELFLLGSYQRIEIGKSIICKSQKEIFWQTAVGTFLKLLK